MVQRKRRRNPDSEESYRRFHDAEPKGWRKINVPELPERAWKLGRLVALVYEPESPSTKKGTAYEHQFPDTGNPIKMAFGKKELPTLYSSEDGKQLLIVRKKSKYYIDPDRGIVG